MLIYINQITDAFRSRLGEWYAVHKRDLPWRNTGNPYLIWVSEIMLQQTRVKQAIPYFERFTAAFPSVRALADANLDQVLKCWEGLGYYARARNMHLAAQIINADFNGVLPSRYEDLLALPGIGPYTAAAIASIAFGAPHAVLDGNVARVLARVTAFDADSKLPASRRALQEAAERLLDPLRAGSHNEAMMELGAEVCTPAQPGCHACPVQPFCRAALVGETHRYPVVAARAAIPHSDIAVGIVVRNDGRMLIARRPEYGLLGGLWEFPGGKVQQRESPEAACIREIREEMNLDVEIEQPFLRIAHAYTHFKITLHAYWCRHVSGDAIPEPPRPVRWVSEAELDNYAFPAANRKLIRHIQHENVTQRRSGPSDLSG